MAVDPVVIENVRVGRTCNLCTHYQRLKLVSVTGYHQPLTIGSCNNTKSKFTFGRMMSPHASCIKFVAVRDVQPTEKKKKRRDE